MAASDLLESLLGVPLTAYFRLVLHLDSPSCATVLGIKTAIFLCCLFSVVLTAIDRYWYIVHPFHYRKHCNTKVAKGTYFFKKKLRLCDCLVF